MNINVIVTSLSKSAAETVDAKEGEYEKIDAGKAAELLDTKAPGDDSGVTALLISGAPGSSFTAVTLKNFKAAVEFVSSNTMGQVTCVRNIDGITVGLRFKEPQVK